jgi:hypothetical protein
LASILKRNLAVRIAGSLLPAQKVVDRLIFLF